MKKQVGGYTVTAAEIRVSGFWVRAHGVDDDSEHWGHVSLRPHLLERDIVLPVSLDEFPTWFDAQGWVDYDGDLHTGLPPGRADGAIIASEIAALARDYKRSVIRGEAPPTGSIELPVRAPNGNV